MKKYIITFIVCLLTTLAAKAQNSIDNLVERYSSSGGSSFTTAVKRNPQTQKVVKVVKTLETDNGEGNTFYRAYNEHTTLLVVEKPQQTRIYMLKRNNANYGQVKVTIIIQPK